MNGDHRPRMSVVMPNYNHGHLIEDALSAFARQTMPAFEVVVVDDGSTDDSVTRLQALAARWPWLKVHQLPANRGVNTACNTGLALVSGDFILFAAADDRVCDEMVDRASAAAAAFPQSGVVFSDQAQMDADGTGAHVQRFDLPNERRYFSGDEFVRLMQQNFFYFHVSSVWFNVPLLRQLGGFPPAVRWHGDLLAAYAAAFERGAVYVPGAVSYFRISPGSYGAAGSRGRAQIDVIRAWHALLKQPGWERRRAGFVAGAILPEYSLRALGVLLRSDPTSLTPRLAGRLAWLVIWTRLAPFVGTGLRRRLRDVRSRLRRLRWRTE